MARPAQIELMRALGPFWEEDDRIVDTLLRTANGPDRSAFKAPREDVLRLQAEFEPLTQMAIERPDDLYEQEYNSRLKELAQGRVTVTLGSTLTHKSTRRYKRTR